MRNLLIIQKNKHRTQNGFTLLIAIVVTSILLIISFFVVNLALKELILANTGEQSQYSFYNAEGGVECALYWDVKNPNSPTQSPIVSAFDKTLNQASISCAGSSISLVHNNADPNKSITTFTVSFSPRGYANVTVTKDQIASTTIISSKGYNTNVSGAIRKLERGVIMTY